MTKQQFFEKTWIYNKKAMPKRHGFLSDSAYFNFNTKMA